MNKTHIDMWDECLSIIKDNISPEQYDAWFKPITSVSYKDHVLRLMVPTRFFAEQLEERYMKILAATLFRIYGRDVQLYYDFFQIGSDPDTLITQQASKESPAVKPGNRNPFQNNIVSDFDSQLNPKYTFENYCGSNCNKIARSISEAIATDSHCKTFNPLFLFGNTGVGKTHLIQAIGIRIKERNPNARVLYVPARLLESQYVAAVAAKPSRINEFINFYQSIEVLIIDDIQDLMHKPGTQNAFFHIFNHLHQNQRQIILSSDCAPADLKEMPERLLSRFKWGMTCQLEAPDYELRRSVLEQRAAQDGLKIPTEVLDYIAANITSSIRELEGVVVSLLAYATVLNREITIDLAQSVLANAVKVQKKSINFDMIAQRVSEFYGIELDQIFSKSRKREISDARQMVMFMAKRHAKMPITAIGTCLSRKHATVHHACHSIEERIPIDSALREDVEKIDALIRN
ncbi:MULTISPECIES: chromosomal replication initiator protein DnaA [Muribaculum]|jgi:chromosomal replication initiator protein|uniref:Chromosomal replication initiator protein DnaA n=1 Tax=Muribaculum caecicola TaxID=3038144 RepID=A0AC61S923_9BACT|nr:MULTISPECIES: chromosomal replication initiator protein DnaA [Muribaculum]THG55324.1 chromosomal replication initiator protein DnaA [Muribaculum caecicola]